MTGGGGVATHQPSGQLERVLDVAAQLLVRHGYRRVSLEEAARTAGVQRALVYAHFTSKEALFLTVLLRAQQRGGAGQIEGMRADPAELLPSRLFRTYYLVQVEDPVLAALNGNAAVFGQLMQEASDAVRALVRQRQRILAEHLTVLRRLGCVRTDRTVEAQVHLLLSLFSGWFLTDALPVLPPGAQVRADLLAEAVAEAVEVPDPPVDALAAEQSALADLHTGLNQLVAAEWQRRIG